MASRAGHGDKRLRAPLGLLALGGHESGFLEDGEMPAEIAVRQRAQLFEIAEG